MMQSGARKTKILLVDTTVHTQVACASVLRGPNGQTETFSVDFVGVVRSGAYSSESLRAEFARLQPDIVILELTVGGTGWALLETVLRGSRCKTIVVCEQARGDLSLRARSLGAVEVWSPEWLASLSKNRNGADLVVRLRTVLQTPSPAARTVKTSTIQPRVADQIMAIAASTGGTEALKVVLGNLPSEIPATVVVQHMPRLFTTSFAAALNQICPFEVKEAEHGDAVIPGRVLLAPGDFHMEIVKKGAFHFIQLHQADQMHGVRPAADYLMKSVAKYAAQNSIGVVLTGMGRDGAQGLLAMKNAGAVTFAQDQKTSVVYGMPKEAFEIGAVDKVLPLAQIAPELALYFGSRARNRVNSGRAS